MTLRVIYLVEGLVANSREVNRFDAISHDTHSSCVFVSSNIREICCHITALEAFELEEFLEVTQIEIRVS
jgi:hypothetical protein